MQKCTCHFSYKDADVCPVKLSYGEWMWMPEVVRVWAKGFIEMCQPDDLHIMDGSEEEDRKVSTFFFKLGWATLTVMATLES
jgi:hypothetical protein